MESSCSTTTAFLRSADRLQEAVDSNEPDLAPLAAVYLGHAHAQRGDDDAAVAAWRTTVASRHPEHGPHAMYEIGLSYQWEPNRRA